MPAPGDTQLAARDYKAAETSFRATLAAQPGDEDARLGLVRALIGQDRTAEAQSEAAAMLKDKPKSAVAEVASSEAAFRAGDLDQAIAHGKSAVADDPCEARAADALADPLEILGYRAMAARFIAQAHRFRPNDESIRRDWIYSLPRKEREAELSRYLEGQHSLSAEDARGFDNMLGQLKAHHAGECRITSKAVSTRLPLVPVYGDHTHPVAFGLDVTFNNNKRRMQIDTGASGIVLTQSAAKALKLQPEYKIKTGGIGDDGELDSFLAHVQSIRIGDVEVSDCMVEVVAKSHLDVDGLIGMDVFSRWLVTLDYPAAEARLQPLPPRPEAVGSSNPGSLDDTGDEPVARDRYIAPEMKDWAKVLRIGHQILLPALFNQDSPVHYLIMDTGASATSLSVAMAKESGKLHGSDVEFVGLSGHVKKAWETKEVPLRVANFLLAPASYYAYDITNISHNNGFETSGLLGLPTLQRLTIQIDYRDNLLKLTYDPKHDTIRF